MLMLRAPSSAYGLAGLVALYSVGLSTLVWVVSGFARFDLAVAAALALPAGAATAATALAVGTRLRAYRIKTRAICLAAVGGVWAFFGAAWPTVQAFEAVTVDGARVAVQAVLMQAALGAGIGAMGGVIGAVAAMIICIKRSR
jgi:hypothetical protein